jgi:hypothetical protein
MLSVVLKILRRTTIYATLTRNNLDPFSWKIDMFCDNFVSTTESKLSSKVSKVEYVFEVLTWYCFLTFL